MRADTHDGPEQIAPLQRPDTLMQLSRSSISEVHLVPHGRCGHREASSRCPLSEVKRTLGNHTRNLVAPQCALIRTEAGWPGNLNRFPVLVILVPSTFRMERSWSR